MRDNRIKPNAGTMFWMTIAPNKHLQIVNMERTKMNDKVLNALSEYLEQ